MYDLSWPEISYRVNLKKGSKTYEFLTAIAPIPTEDLIRLDRSFNRPSKAETGGGTITDLSPSGLEITLFDQYFQHADCGGIAINGVSREAVLAKLPSTVKRVTIREGVGGVWIDENAPTEKGTWEDLNEQSTTVKVVAVANATQHELYHRFSRDPTAEEELAYRRAAGGSIRTLPGRRRREFMTVENFSVYPKLYDGLIESVEGYFIDSAAIGQAETRNQWLSRIPYYHKKVVVQHIFGSAQSQDQDDEFFRSRVRDGSDGDET